MTKLNEHYRKLVNIFVSIVKFWAKVTKIFYIFLHSQSLNIGFPRIVVTLDTMVLIAEANPAENDNKSLFCDK